MLSNRAFRVNDSNGVGTAISKLLDNEFEALSTAHEARCTMSDFTPEHIGTFSLTWLAEVQFQYAPTLVALVPNLVGPNGGAIDSELEDAGEEQPKGQRKLGNQRTRDTAIIATAAVALLCYAKSNRSNALQDIVGYFLFASNTAKWCAEVLHRLGLTVAYGTMNSALRFNAEASLVKMGRWY